MIVAIDGPAGAGKGTIARRLADHYGLAHLDTGKLYRAVAAAARDAGVDFDDDAALARLAEGVDLAMLDAPRLLTRQTGADASKVARHPSVRAALLKLQKDFAARPEGAVIDGRDIGTVVCPHADAKIFVTASPQARAARRARELEALGERVDVAALAADLAERDARDADRAVSPMRPADDAALLDTTSLSIDAACEEARRLVDAAVMRANAG